MSFRYVVEEKSDLVYKRLSFEAAGIKDGSWHKVSLAYVNLPPPLFSLPFSSTLGSVST